MGLTVKVGEVYTEIKRGTSAKGEYAYVTAKAEKGSDKISVFFANPEDVPEDAYAVSIDEIQDVTVSSKQYNGNWYKNISINAKVSAVDGGANPIDLAEGELPF